MVPAGVVGGGEPLGRLRLHLGRRLGDRGLHLPGVGRRGPLLLRGSMLQGLSAGSHGLGMRIRALGVTGLLLGAGLCQLQRLRGVRGEESDGMKFSTKTKMIIGDPSYFPGKVQVVGHLLKAICILNHPIDRTNDSDSLQLIIPQSQVGRKNDIYIAMVSSAHNVCPKRSLH